MISWRCKKVNEYQLTFTLASFLWDLVENHAVGRTDDEQGQPVERDHVEQVVGQLVHGRREKVEGDALLEPTKLRMLLDVENYTLQR